MAQAIKTHTRLALSEVDTPMPACEMTALVIEDESALRSLIEMEFVDLGFKTLGAEGVQDALAKAKAALYDIDLCVMDLRLPDGNGIALLKELKQFMPQVPMILMTGHGNKSTVLEALKNGAYDFLEKPFSMANDLLPVLKRAMEAIRLQKENNALGEQILHNSKLAALGELAATVLHEIRGPLSLIQVVCDDFEDELTQGPATLQPDAVAANLAQIRRACGRIGRLGDHLRDYARQDRDEKLENRAIETLIEESLFMVLQKIRRLHIGVQKVIEPSAQGLVLHCYAGKIEQVIMNLLSNACDAMSASEKRILSVTVSADSHAVKIQIGDTGTGIAAELHERIFENFFTTKPKGEGTGLGLNIVRNIVREHAGEIHLSSAPGVGSTFTVAIPLLRTQD